MLTVEFRRRAGGQAHRCHSFYFSVHLNFFKIKCGEENQWSVNALRVESISRSAFFLTRGTSPGPGRHSRNVK